jgi:hypothetical protein
VSPGEFIEQAVYQLLSRGERLDREGAEVSALLIGKEVEDVHRLLRRIGYWDEDRAATGRRSSMQDGVPMSSSGGTATSTSESGSRLLAGLTGQCPAAVNWRSEPFDDPTDVLPARSEPQLPDVVIGERVSDHVIIAPGTTRRGPPQRRASQT